MLLGMYSYWDMQEFRTAQGSGTRYAFKIRFCIINSSLETRYKSHFIRCCQLLQPVEQLKSANSNLTLTFLTLLTSS